jgi:maltose alpha-D-glucosyltransferase/alpha-amylase
MPRLYMAVRRADRLPITDIFTHTPAIPPACQWCLFLRNHDELTLEMVTNEERDYMYYSYATDPQMKLNLGIRRRLAPLMDNDRRRIELLNCLLLTLPGSPIVYYGDEIGMGDNIYLGDRNGVRTPMQWSSDRNAGFSAAEEGRLYLPVITDPVYGYQSVNVAAQERTPSSLLSTMKRLIAARKRTPAFGRGSIEFLRPRNQSVLAFLRRHADDTILVVCNLSERSQPVELDLSAYRGAVPTELLGETRFPPITAEPYFLSLGAHGFYWFRLEQRGRPVRYGIEDTAI